MRFSPRRGTASATVAMATILRNEGMVFSRVLLRPSRSSFGDSPVGKLGGPQDKDPPAGQRLELANSNFAEVGNGRRNLIPKLSLRRLKKSAFRSSITAQFRNSGLILRAPD